jgi:hypothetical protein
LNFLTWLFLVFAFRFCRLRKGMGYEEVNIWLEEDYQRQYLNFWITNPIRKKLWS